MLELVMKDFRVHKKQLLRMTLFFPTFTGALHLMGHKDMELVPVIGISMLLSNLFAGDEPYQTNILFSSFPYRRSSIITARYITVWLGTIAAMFLSIGCELVAAAWQPGAKAVSTTLPMTPTGYGMVVCIVMIVLPFIFLRGRLSFPILGAFTFAALFGPIMLTPMTDFFYDVAHLAQRPPLGSGMKYAIDIALGIILLVLVTLVSRRISVRVFEKKDLA